MKFFIKTLNARDAVSIADAVAKEAHAITESVSITLSDNTHGFLVVLKGDTIPEWLTTEEALKRALDTHYAWWSTKITIL